jgi:uncharacterized alpha-E superfamily protein
MLEVIEELIERLSALSGLIAENMMRGPAHAFIDMGRRVERALSICRVTRGLQASGQEGLNVLLELCDSQITYRSRYLSGAAPLQVLDLVLLDPDNPRSLAFQVEALVQRISGLPPLDDRNLPEQTLLDARAILAPLQAQAIADVDSGTLHAIEIQLLSLSDRISERYFLPNETVAPRQQGRCCHDLQCHSHHHAVLQQSGAPGPLQPAAAPHRLAGADGERLPAGRQPGPRRHPPEKQPLARQ